MVECDTSDEGWGDMDGQDEEWGEWDDYGMEEPALGKK